jgi:pimeloyl-ACP methyl ester carboxylesterase
MRALLPFLLLAAIGAVSAVFHARLGWHPAWALAASASIALAIHVLVIAAGFALSRSVASPIPPARRRRGDLLRAFLGEIKVSLWTFHWAMPLRAQAPAPQPAAGAAGVPVLLLHGYLCNRGMWGPTMEWLAARGHPVQAISLTPVFTGIEAYAEQVGRAVSALCHATGQPQVHLLCHSMGGLVARYYVHASGGAPQVARIVTLGSPHAGTRHAWLGLGRNAHQMRRGGSWLAALEHIEAQHPEWRARMVTAMSYHDNIVAPQTSSLLPGAVHECFTGIGHLQMATDERVLQAIAHYF